MKSISINELKNYFNQEITISGFVDNIRNLQWVQFIILRDNTGKVQITIEKSEENNKEMVELFEKLPLEAIETSFRYTGPRHLMDRFPFALGIKSNHPRLSFPRDSLFLISALVMTRLWLEI